MSMQPTHSGTAAVRPPASLTLARLGAVALFAAAAAMAQDYRPIAFTNARLVTAAGAVIDSGTLVIRAGKIEALGKDTAVPAGARVIDASGKTIMPGLVCAVSNAGLTQPTRNVDAGPQRGGRRGRQQIITTGGANRTSNQAATKVIDGLYARQPIFGDLLRAGITSLALTPQGAGFPGLGAVLDPSGANKEQLTRDDEAFVQIGMQRDGTTKKLLKETLAKAKEVVAEREKPKEAAKPAPAAEQPKPEPAKPEAKEPPKDEPKPEPKPPQPEPAPQPTPKPQGQEQKPAEQKQPEKPKDPNLEVLADLLQKKRRAIVRIDSAADFLHWRNAVDDDIAFPRALAVSQHDQFSGTIDLVLEHVKKWDCPVLLPPSLSTLPRTQHLTNPAKQLHDAGVEIGFLVGDDKTSSRAVFFQLMELVRSGLPADVAIAAVTKVPAKVLGIDGRTGSLEVGKDADLLLFDGDPLSPEARLQQIWLRGREVLQP